MRTSGLVSYFFGLILGFALAGCTVGPDYQSPEMKEAPRRSASDVVGSIVAVSIRVSSFGYRQGRKGLQPLAVRQA